MLSMWGQPASATLPPPSGYSHLVFDDTFGGTALNSSHWDTYITSRAAGGAPWHANAVGGSSEGAQFNAAYFKPSAVSVNNGLTLAAHRRSGQRGYSWTGSVVCTYGHFEFTGGYVQISAQTPIGNGMWSAFWMLPGPAGTHGDDNEIDIFESGFTGNGLDPYENDAWHLESPSGRFGNDAPIGTRLLSGYHVYGLSWVPGRSITWYLDGAEVGQLTSAQTAIPDEPMELILSQSVANHHSAGWHQPVNSRTHSPESMQVAEVQVWQ